MKVAFDTSVLVPALIPALPAHADSYSWVCAAVDGRIDGVMSWHAFAETWAVLTRLPMQPAPTPASARAALESLRKAIRRIPVDGATYDAAVARCIERGLRSGAIFDALHVICAEKAGANVIVTADVSDFERLVGADGPAVVAASTAPEAVAKRRRR
ncbi:MAG TPA: PIN domain-containing protein [Candidatus Binatia bacterium]|nr:PIN domain-containing protein [Candidatus Binatia bacterium]